MEAKIRLAIDRDGGRGMESIWSVGMGNFGGGNGDENDLGLESRAGCPTL